MDQGLQLRVVGVCDSQSLVVTADVFTMGLSDTSLMEICQKKSSGSPLTALNDFGISLSTKYLIFVFYIFILLFVICESN